MKTELRLLLTMLGVFSTLFVNAQRAKDGDYTVSSVDDIVNTYTSLTANANAGATSITVSNNAMTGGAFGGALAPGDIIMIIQMQGAIMDATDWPVTQGWGPYTVPAAYLWSGTWSDHIHEWGQLNAHGSTTYTDIWGANINGYANAGKFEQVEVEAVSGGNTILLQCGLQNSYTASGHVQIVRIPRFDNLTVTNGNSITAPDWNGTTGGVVALEVNNTLDVNAGGLIHADEKGFRGGQLDGTGQSGGGAVNEVRFLGTPNAIEGSEKGEGIHGHYTELDAISSRYGIGAPTNGGGGGGYQNCGGGGGSNVYTGTDRYTGSGYPDAAYNTNWALDFSWPDNNSDPQTYSNLVGNNSPGGGRGGYALADVDNNENVVGPRNTAWGGDGRKTNGGRGGHPLKYDATTMYFGGGGGAGDQDSGEGGAGGRGGGIVYIACYGTVTGSGTISANGQDGEDAGGTNPTFGQPRTGNDGAGGGGAGGSIYIENATALPASISLDAIGGDGGDQDIRLFFQTTPFPINTSDEAAGPGGSGTGGAIAFTSGTPTQNASAGANGVVVSRIFNNNTGTLTANGSAMMANFPPNGATNGAPGETSLSAPYYDLVGTDVTVCAGQPITNTISVLGTLPGGSTIEWFDMEFGGTVQHTGTSYPSPAVTTTYYVGVCPGTFRIPITITVTAADDASFASSDFCVSTVNTISGVVTAGGTYSIQSQTGSGGVTIDGTSGVLSNFVGGDQVTIEYTTPAGPCQNSSTQVVNVLPGDDASFTSADYCEGSSNTISGVATLGGTYTIQSQTGSGTVTIASGTGVLSNGVAGDQITIEYTTAGVCPNSSTQVVNIVATDDASFTTSDFCVSSVNIISGVVTPGGTYTIQSQTGSGAVTITGGTGILANYSAGDQVTIEYTTSGTCPSSSTQTVNVTNLDDASFSTSDFCESTSNTISGVATPGGTYSIQSQTGSGGVTIDGATGILSNGVAGDQITIEYTTPAGGCQNSSTQVVNVTGPDDASFSSSDFCVSGSNTISGVATPGGTYSIQSQTGSGAVTIDGTTGVLSNFTAGDQVTIEYTTPAGGCQNSSTQVVNVTPLDDASFVSSDFCVSSVNTISGVVTGGGTYTIQSQTGSGGVTIDGTTGLLSNFTAGDQITIEYTTPAAGCQNSSTQVVNVTPLDDASFMSSDFCVSAVNVISGVATPGGTYTIQSQTGSGAVTIDGTTGVLSNFAAGDQITIEYTTPATGCQNSSTQVVNVTPLDDASFVSSDFCENSANTISGVVTPGGTYTIQTQTGSGGVTIDGTTGVLSNVVAGDQITIEYTTPAAGCQNSSTQTVNVTAMDDASFDSYDFCESSVNTISNVAIPGGTFNIQSQTGSGGVTIDGTTGVLSNFVAGDQITIEYTTPAGGCQNSSTVVVNVTTQDDASFTTSDFCESAVNIVSGVATPGGVFTIQSQTGSGGVTIDGATGELSNVVGGDQVTIEYTTPAGACQSSSTQVVDVLQDDNGSFALTATCDGGTALITGDTGGTFTFVTAPADMAVIDGTTGTISGATNGSTYDVSYTTTGACPVTVTETLTVLSLDDASFSLVPTCDGATAIVQGTVGGTFSFTATPVDGAMIDGSTGAITGGEYNSMYDVMYLTSGACPDSTIETVVVNDCTSEELIVPTAITPGGDNTNDTWKIPSIDNIYPNNRVIVYNRWGSVVFDHASSPANPYSENEWDGTFKGQPLPVASYFFIIETNDGSGDEIKGTVTIIRN